jgi:hypothetical protein
MMKKLFVILSIFVFLSGCGTLSSNKRDARILSEQEIMEMAVGAGVTKIRPFTTRTGGGTGALDKIDSTDLGDNDGAMVYEISGTTTTVYMYVYDSDGTDAESDPDVIRPDNQVAQGAASSYPGNWRLVVHHVKELNLSRSSQPQMNFGDLEATAGDTNAQIWVNCPDDYGDGTEDCDLKIKTQVGGSLSDIFYIDADDGTGETDVQIYTSELRCGTDDSQRCLMSIYSPTATGYGGTLRVYVNAADDGTISYYHFTPYEDDLYIGPSNAVDAFMYDGSNARWQLNKPLVGSQYILGAINTIGTWGAPTATNPYSLSSINAYSSIIYYGATGTINLPAVGDGMSLCVMNTGAFTVTINPDDADLIVREGTAQTAGVSITLSSGAGNFVCLASDGVNWQTWGAKGTLSQGG